MPRIGLDIWMSHNATGNILQNCSWAAQTTKCTSGKPRQNEETRAEQDDGRAPDHILSCCSKEVTAWRVSQPYNRFIAGTDVQTKDTLLSDPRHF